MYSNLTILTDNTYIRVRSYFVKLKKIIKIAEKSLLVFISNETLPMGIKTLYF